MVNITSNNKMNQLVRQLNKVVINHLADRSIELLKQIAQRQMSFGGSEWYERSNEFENAWGEISRTLRSTTVGYLEDNITSVIERYQHGSPQWGEFVGDDLATAIMKGYEVFNTGVMIMGRDIWQEFENSLVIYVPIWVEEALAKVSI